MRSKLALVACGKGGLVWQVAVSGAGIVQSDWLIDEGAFCSTGATVQWSDGILTATFQVMGCLRRGGLVWQVAVSGAGIVQSDWLIDEGGFCTKRSHGSVG
ncbi:hypothetical protein CEXT_179841 [Caerostris extrusa]|uniref:Uncharacterized protein n=1 Tax=Caerostris extrusa TaxID=172846 RepID=A0AAV4NKK3_CAEEX|nr:hypothetical protein CEXT_179841 [Caerostris extrusa]